MKKKDIIMSTALRLFAVQGFSATSTLALAREAKVAEGTIFRHFTDKEAIFSEILSGLYQRVRADFEASQAARAPESGLLNIRYAINSFFAFALDNRDYFSIFFREASTRYMDTDSRVFQEIKSIYAYISSFLGACIREGQKDGSIRKGLDAETCAFILSCSIIGFARARHFELVDASPGYLDELWRQFEGALKNLEDV
jgi:AcrR family transcriptional regulator